MRHIIDAIAAQGRDKDTELLHVTKNELAGLDALKHHLSGSGLSRNPRTGLPEAGFFEQYVVPALPAVAGLAAGAFTGGVGAVPVATAVGAATGAATKGLQGGSTQDVLMGGVLGGIAGYGMGGIGAGLAEGAATVGAEATKTAAANTAAAGADAGANAANVAGSVETGAGANGMINNAYNLGTTPGADMSGAGGQNLFQGTPNATTPNVFGSNAPTIGGNAALPVGGMPQTGTTTVLSGTSGPVDIPTSAAQTPAAASTPAKTGINWGSLASKNTLSNLMPAATGTIGLAALNPNTTSSVTGEPVDESMPNAEVYYTPYGERRTRIVGAAQGGLMGFADYDAADAEADGGYAPGGVAGYAEGGIASMARGRYLQGPGDGMSDSIPASIDGKQEARLATGEFVVPADVVSHLGNGDSTAGAKQLHQMMDRARMTRTGTKQQGKQINPRKVMPV